MLPNVHAQQAAVPAEQKQSADCQRAHKLEQLIGFETLSNGGPPMGLFKVTQIVNRNLNERLVNAVYTSESEFV